jgi:serralysin
LATITLYDAAPDYQWWPDYFEPGMGGTIPIATSQVFNWVNPDGSSVWVAGTGFSYSGGVPNAGRVDSVTVYDSTSTKLLSFTGLSVDLPSIHSFAFGFTSSGGFIQNPDGFGLVSILTTGNDTIVGSSHGDDLLGGRNIGNDLIYGGGGFDVIKGDAGSDTIDAGGGVLTYFESFWDPSALGGVAVSMNSYGQGSAIDCWGGSDQFSNVSRVEGSRFADVFRGSQDPDYFMGLRGADNFDGGNTRFGYDQVLYWKDDQLGGHNGIRVNLSIGQILDGWGSIDKVTNIHGVVGTRYGDIFIGSSGEDLFVGGEGLDQYNGLNGVDLIDFYWGSSTSGAQVNLAKGTVANDGFGNAEILSNIESLDGTDLDDRFTGNAGINTLKGYSGDDVLAGAGGRDFLQGDAGADTLTGGAGTDEFLYSRRAGLDPWGDTITDFVSSSDYFLFIVADFVGMDTIVRFRNGPTAGGTGSWFYFKDVNDGLYWDADGTGTGAAVLVATLTGVSRINAHDIHLL